MAACADIENLSTVKPPRVHVCEACMRTGDPWVHLRTYQACGVTLCCDSSPNKRASKHARSSHHPVIASAEPGERCCTATTTRSLPSTELQRRRPHSLPLFEFPLVLQAIGRPWLGLEALLVDGPAIDGT